MEVVLYKNKSAPNVLTKNISKVRTVAGVIFKDKNNLDILRPVIVLNLGDSMTHFVDFNYVHIEGLHRYYYVDDIATVAGLVEVTCRVDVLMSHKKDIQNSTQYILRQQSRYENPYLMDNLLPISAKHNYLAAPFGNNVFKKDCSHIIMATTGKGGNPV